MLLRRRTAIASAAALAIAVSLGFLASQHMAALAAVRARNAGASLAGRTAIVVGGTAGIGKGIAVRLAAAKAAVTIVGRDAARGAAVVAELQAASGPGVAHTFEAVDGSLLSNAKAFSEAWLARHPALDVLVLTQGIATLQGRTETAEGLDVKLALHYYARMAYVAALLPGLRAAAAAAGADDTRTPRVLTVLSAGVHSPYAHAADDPELKTHYTLKNAADGAGLYNDIAVDALASAPGNERITFVHAAPGFVNSNWGTEMPAPVRWLLAAVKPFGTSLETVGEFMCAPLLAPSAGGFKLIGASAQDVPPTSAHAAERDGVWRHTREVLARAGLTL